METQKTLDQAIEMLTQLRVEMQKQGVTDLDDKASDINLLLCKAHDQCALPPVVVSEAELPSDEEIDRACDIAERLHYKNGFVDIDYENEREYARAGAKWMREEIRKRGN